MGRQRNITFDELSEYIKKSEETLRQTESALIGFYEKNLEHDIVFIRDIYKLLSGHKILTYYHKVSPEPTLYEILLYVYLLPWKFNGNEIPHFENEEWKKWHYTKAKSKKVYYSDIKVLENRETHIASLNVSKFISDNIDLLNASSPQPKDEETLLRDTLNNILKWSSLSNDGTFCGKPLYTYPLISLLTVLKKRAFFLIDLGVALYTVLQHTALEDEPPLIIPKNILNKQIIGLTKSSVTAEVEYDAESENVQLKSSKYHTVFDVVSLASELSNIDSDEERMEKVTTAIDTIRAENRTFSNINARDFSALSNIIKMFYHNDEPILETTLGDLCDSALAGIADREMAQHRRKDCLLETLEIVHKWSSYTFDLGANNGRISVLNYVSGKYTDPETLAEAIKNGDVRGEFLLPGSGISGKALPDTSYINKRSSELEKIPVHLELSSIFRKSIEHDHMTRQFESYYGQLNDDNSRTIYSFLEMLRKDAGYPSVLYIPYKDFMNAFPGIKKNRLLKTIDRVLDELLLIGALKKSFYSEAVSSYSLEFN